MDRILDTTGNQSTCLQWGISRERSISGSLAGIAVMKAADQGQFDDVALIGRLDGTRFRTILFQRPVRAMSMIIGQVVRESSMQMVLIEHDHVVQTFPTDGADQALDKRILPR